MSFCQMETTHRDGNEVLKVTRAISSRRYTQVLFPQYLLLKSIQKDYQITKISNICMLLACFYKYQSKRAISRLMQQTFYNVSINMFTMCMCYTDYLQFIKVVIVSRIVSCIISNIYVLCTRKYTEKIEIYTIEIYVRRKLIFHLLCIYLYLYYPERVYMNTTQYFDRVQQRLVHVEKQLVEIQFYLTIFLNLEHLFLFFF